MHVAIAGPADLRAFQDEIGYRGGGLAESIAPAYGTNVNALAGALWRSGHTVTVVTHRRGMPQRDWSAERATYAQVGSRASAPRQALDHWRVEVAEMALALRSSEADIVHGHWTYEWALAALESGKPALLTIHDAPFTILKHMPSLYRVSRLLLSWRVRNRADGALLSAVSPHVGEMWARQMRCSIPVTTIPNIVPIPPWAPQLQPPNSLTFVEVASSDPWKNVPVLLIAFARVVDLIPRAQLVLIGPGLERTGKIAKKARTRGLDRNVVFRGALSREATLRELSRARAHVHVSLEESFGNTVVESLALGTPVIAGNRAGGIPWILRNGELGSLVDVSNPSAIAEEMYSLAQDDSKWIEFSARGRASFDNEYSAESVADQYLGLYARMSAIL